MGPQPLGAYHHGRKPRADIPATTFTINRFGAPSMIVNAKGDTTLLRRLHPVFPTLVTTFVQSNGFETAMSYSSRGLPELVTAINPYGTGSNAYTVYRWNSTWDMVDTAFAPGDAANPAATGERTVFHYDGQGNRDWQEDGRGGLSRVVFHYDGYNRLDWLQAPGNTGAQLERIAYDDRLGNVESQTSPLGFVSTYLSDALGRDSVVRTPVDGEGQVQLTDRRTYDFLGRLIDQRSESPAINYSFAEVSGGGTAPASTLHVATTYDSEGNVLSLMRESLTPQGAAQSPQQTSTFTYDAAHRKFKEVNSGREHAWVYDAAGNVTRDSTGLGVITMGYDSLNRVVTRVVPGRTVATATNPVPDALQGFPGIFFPYPYFRRSPTDSSVVIFADTARFAYDAAGNLTRADNHDAQVRRGYFANGLLQVDTLRVAKYTVDTSLPTPQFTHEYVLTSTYDLAGRRVVRRDSLTTCVGCTQSYHYGAASGLLDSTYDAAGPSLTRVPVQFVYDSAGRLKARSVNSGKVTLAQRYDAEGRLTNRDVVTTDSPRPTVYSDALAYDARGKLTDVLIASDVGELADHWENRYTGLGALTAHGRVRGGGQLVDHDVVDALGNVLRRISCCTGIDTVLYAYNGDQLSTMDRQPRALFDNGGVVDSTIFNRAYANDAAGNQISERHWVWRYSQTVNGIPQYNYWAQDRDQWWTWATYGVDGKLRVAQRSWYDGTGHRTVLSEYRYDALGRRVLARTRRDTTCATTGGTTPYECLSTMERFVWDGDQVLAEFRTNGSDTLSVDALESEVDNSSPLYGQVRYLHAAGIDEPVVVWKDGTGVVPHLSWRGQYEAGSDITTGALLEGGSGTSTWVWPARYRDIHLAPELRTPIPEPTRWLGSVVEGQVELNGLAYRRNRYYNPMSGRFTQEDPIGLSGGLNLYGFTAGDPVNFSDPFGLCKNPTSGGFSSLQCAWDDFKAGAVQAAGRLAKSFLDYTEASAGRALQCMEDPTCVGLSFGGGGMMRVGEGLGARFIAGSEAVSFGNVVGRGTVDLAPVLERITAGEKGGVFGNFEGLLPQRAAGYYTKHVVPTPGVKGPGPQRLVIGQKGELYYSPDHYKTFTRVNP